MTEPDRPRRPRADAARNRELLLRAAAEVAARQDDELSLSAVAEQAGVGIGTLYRHFPTRGALVAALYRDEVDRLGEAAAQLARDLPPLDALSAWLHKFATLLAVKHGLADAMKDAAVLDADMLANAHVTMIASATRLLDAAVRAGVVRNDVDPIDLLFAVASTVPVSLKGEDAQNRHRRLLGLIIDGLRFGAGG